MPTTDPMPVDLGGTDLSGTVLIGADRTGTPLSTRLLACRDAEDYFAALDVPFDPQVLQVNRLHVLRLFGPALQEYLASPVDAETQAAERLREALAAAHEAFTVSTSLDHRLFKVLQDRAPRGFVPLDSINVEPSVKAQEKAGVKADVEVAR